MNELVNPVAVSCHNCGNPTKPKLIPRKEPNGEIIQEAKWVCGRCGSFFKQGIAKASTAPYSVR